MNLSIENLPWANILYIENQLEGRFAIKKTFRGMFSIGDAFS